MANPELVTITNGALFARINPLGAELWSLTDAAGREYMTSADPAFWTGHAPLLFPIVGALNLSEVVLSGPEELLAGALIDALGETLRNRTMAGFHSDVTLRMTSQGRDIVLRGCVVMVLSAQLGVS